MEYQSLNDSFLLSTYNDQKIGLYTNSFNFDNPKYHKIYKENFGFINYLGNYGNRENRIFVFAKNSKKKFLTINYSLTNKNKIIEKVLDFKLKGELYLGNFTYNNRFYIIGWKKNTRILTLNKFDEDFATQRYEIDLEKGQFLMNGIIKDKIPPLPSNAIYSDPTYSLGHGIKEFRWIRDDIPNPNKDVTSANKMYIRGNLLTLSLDSNKKQTSLIQIDLDSHETKTHVIENTTSLKLDAYNHKTNSYIINDLLFQLKGDKKKIGLSVFNLTENEKKQLISFNRTTPYYKDKNLMVTEDIIKKYNLNTGENNKESNVQKRLKKIMRSGNKVGMQITENDSVFLITLGGYMQKSGGSPMMMGAPGAPGFGGVTFSFGYYGTFIRDESLNFYVSKDKPSLTYSDFENPYEQMATFLEEEYEGKQQKKSNRIAKFKIGFDYYLGYMDKKTRTYFFRKFN